MGPRSGNSEQELRKHLREIRSETSVRSWVRVRDQVVFANHFTKDMFAVDMFCVL